MKTESTQSLIHTLHLAQDALKRYIPESGVVDGRPPWALALTQEVLGHVSEEERPAVLAKIEAILEDSKEGIIQEQRQALERIRLLKEELATRPHLRRPAQERRKRQENARKFRGQGKSKNR